MTENDSTLAAAGSDSLKAASEVVGLFHDRSGIVQKDLQLSKREDLDGLGGTSSSPGAAVCVIGRYSAAETAIIPEEGTVRPPGSELLAFRETENRNSGPSRETRMTAVDGSGNAEVTKPRRSPGWGQTFWLPPVTENRSSDPQAGKLGMTAVYRFRHAGGHEAGVRPSGLPLEQNTEGLAASRERA
jgi:hypothetical protein